MFTDVVSALEFNLLSPPILFFALGVVATLVRSDLKFPEPLYAGLTIYLLAAIGFKGGVALSKAGLGQVWLPALGAVAVSALIPVWSFLVLRVKFARVDAAAIAAHYGSVSAVTFLAAVNFVESRGVPQQGFMAALLALMEAPAIICALCLARSGGPAGEFSWKHQAHEALTGRGVLLLIGGLVVGLLAGERGWKACEGFFGQPFQGVLALFLLEMGLVASRRFGDLRKAGWFLILFAVLAPLLHGVLGVFLGHALGLRGGDLTLFATLCASASYIAAPAAVRVSLPEANPAFYLTAVLAVTFPFNLTFGLPLYHALAGWWQGA